MSTFDFIRLKRTVVIYRVVQVILLALLIVMAFLFQTKYPGHFFKSFVAAVVVQGCLIYPIYRLAWRDSGIDFDSSSTTLTPEQMTALRKKRLLGDLWKVSLIIFFFIFVARAPEASKLGTPFFQSTPLFAFLLLFLTYFQCFNYSVKKRLTGIDK